MFEDEIAVVGSVLILIVVISVGCFAGIRVLDKVACGSYSEQTGRATKYGFLECYVQSSDSAWYSRSEFEKLLITKSLTINAEKGN
jgi:hypothetical protein